jgi:hypothetical protein
MHQDKHHIEVVTSLYQVQKLNDSSRQVVKKVIHAIVRLTCTSYDHVFAEDIRQMDEDGLNRGKTTVYTLVTAKSKVSASSRGIAVPTKKQVEDFNQSTAVASDDANDGRELEASVLDRDLGPRKSAQYVFSDTDYEDDQNDDDDEEFD